CLGTRGSWRNRVRDPHGSTDEQAEALPAGVRRLVVPSLAAAGGLRDVGYIGVDSRLGVYGHVAHARGALHRGRPRRCCYCSLAFTTHGTRSLSTCLCNYREAKSLKATIESLSLSSLELVSNVRAEGAAMVQAERRRRGDGPS